MKSIAPFRKLKKGERELSKNEIANYLNLYYNFIVQLVNNKDKIYIEIFKKIVNKKNNCNIVNNAASFIDYDYMIQIAELELLRKYFSYLIDYNIDFIDDNNKIEIKKEYYIEGSREFSTKNFIKLLRNALNHNDKQNFQLFRIIQPENDIDLYIEVYLRKPNFHIQIKIKDLLSIFSSLLKVNSFYEIKFYDEQKQKIDLSNFSLKKDKKILLCIEHLYDFDTEKGKLTEDGIMIINENDANVFSKMIELTEKQKQAAINTKNKLSMFYDKSFDIWNEEIIIDTIPFGMCKLDGYLADIHYLQQELYNPKGRLCDYIMRYSKNDNINRIDKTKMFYHLINNYGLLTRSFSLYASYIFDTVIPEGQAINIKRNKEDKNKYRNSFVHGRWYSYWDEKDNLSFELCDYEHGDNNIMKINNTNIKNITIEELNNYLNMFIRYEKSDFPISLITDGSKMGYHIIRRKDGITYYCNMSITTSSPIFLVVAQKNNDLFIPPAKEIDQFFDNIENIPKEKLDDRIYQFIVKLPEISKKALKTIMETDNENKYRKKLELEIYELYDICLEIKKDIQKKVE